LGYARTLEREHKAVGKRLAQVMPQDESVACLMDAGAVSYYSRLRSYDFGKLNNEYLAARERTPQEVADYFFQVRPGAALFTTRNLRRVEYLPESEAIVGDSRFAEYDLIETYRPPPEAGPSTYYQFLYLRSDLRDLLKEFTTEPQR
jgi:hypothetical protein